MVLSKLGESNGGYECLHLSSPEVLRLCTPDQRAANGIAVDMSQPGFEITRVVSACKRNGITGLAIPVVMMQHAVYYVPTGAFVKVFML